MDRQRLHSKAKGEADPGKTPADDRGVPGQEPLLRGAHPKMGIQMAMPVLTQCATGFTLRSMAKRTTLSISLTPELEEFVASRVGSGRYQSASEVVRQGLRLLQDQETTRQAQL